MTAYEPGTFAVATVRGVPDVRVMRRGLKIGMYDWAHSTEQTGYSCSHDDEVTDIRPLVVLDLARTKGRTFLPGWLRIHATEIARKSAGGHASVADDLRYIADQIEAQTKPPTPAEPTDPAVRVLDSDGQAWVSFEGQWSILGVNAKPRPWDELLADYGPLEIRP